MKRKREDFGEEEEELRKEKQKLESKPNTTIFIINHLHLPRWLLGSSTFWKKNS